MSNGSDDRAQGRLCALLGRDGLSRLLRLLVEGRPLALDEAGAATGLGRDRLEAVLLSEPGTDWDDQGRLVGFGLTMRQTPHRFIVDDRILYTWCAMDTLFFPVLIGRPASVASICPATGTSISFDVTPDTLTKLLPPSAVVGEGSRPDAQGIRAEVCDHGHFFASPEASAGWQWEHPTGRVIGVHEAYLAARAVYAVPSPP